MLSDHDMVFKTIPGAFFSNTITHRKISRVFIQNFFLEAGIRDSDSEDADDGAGGGDGDSPAAETAAEKETAERLRAALGDP